MRSKDAFLIATVGLLLLRLATLGAFPLMDTSEARYAEIARLMAESGDWVTPWFEPGVPFWGKPPLAFWLSAASFRLFGVTEFAARLPHWLLGAGTLWLVAGVARAGGATAPWRPAFLLAASALFFVACGAVLTDGALLFAVTLCLAAAHHVLLAARPGWRWLFFVGLALGALAKGPVAWVLILGPLFAWTLACGRLGDLWRLLPWLRGGLLTAALTLPWYVAAEMKTPGFLDYFLLGEHFRRFIDAGWQGDLYGVAHQQPRGTIWLLALAAALPWPLLLPVALWRRIKAGHREAPADAQDREASRFFLAWALAPLVLFTFAGNILWTYVLPGLPGLALWLDRNRARLGLAGLRLAPAVGAVTPLLFAAFIATTALAPAAVRSEKALLRALPAEVGADALYYVGQRPFSARFYSGGRAGLVLPADLPRLLAAGSAQPRYLAVQRALVPDLTQGLPLAGAIAENQRFVMFRIR